MKNSMRFSQLHFSKHGQLCYVVRLLHEYVMRCHFLLHSRKLQQQSDGSTPMQVQQAPEEHHWDPRPLRI